MQEDILNLLENKSYTLSKLAKKLKIDKDILKTKLKELIKGNIITKFDKNYYILYSGKITINKSGFYGFITPLDDYKNEDIYTEDLNKLNVQEGDIVKYFIIKNNYNHKNEAIITKIIDHSINEIVGVVSAKMFNSKLKASITLIDESRTFPLLNAKESYDKAIAKCELTYDKFNNIMASLKEIVAYKDDPGKEISAIAAMYNFNVSFPIEVKEEVQNIPSSVREEDLKNRTDFRDLEIITIDGDDSKDFDDAIYVKKNGENYLLGVYIADVSNYVLFNHPLDIEAYDRGTSVYLADRVIPMLPRELSNGICSLNEGEDRLVLACIMNIDSNGRCLDSKIVEGVIKSKHRMTYNKVNKIINGDKDLIDQYHDIYQMLIEANELHHILRNKRENEGSLDFDLPEYSFILNKDGSPKDIIKRERNDAEKLIEDFMIYANSEVAKHMMRLDLPFLYRVHDKPSEEKMANFFSFINDNESMKLIKRGIKPKNVQKILKDLSKKENNEILNNLLLRSMAKAKYSNDNIGHFGLALKNYCHFTSPIRRYPDLIVHRIIKDLILHPKNYEARYCYYLNNLKEIGLKTSIRERNAIECERDVDDMLYAWYMEKNIDKFYKGVITSIVSFGMYVEIDKGIEGLVHIKNINGYYTFDEKKLELISPKHTFKIGDKVEIVVIGSDRRTRKIDFMLKEDYIENEDSSYK